MPIFVKKINMELLINLKDERINRFNLSLSEIVLLNTFEQKSEENTLNEVYTIFESMGFKKDTIYRSYCKLKEKGVVDYDVARRGHDLYLVADIEKTVLKIGASNNINDRFGHLKTGNHLEIEILFKKEGKGFFEKEIHSKFKKFRLSGEWFKYDESIINYFRNEI